MKIFTETDMTFEGTTMHVWRGGEGQSLLLLHGSGAGAATLSNFQCILEPLAEHFDVMAADLVGFGRSGRKANAPYFDVEMWVRQVQCLIQGFSGQGKVGLLGHSLSGALALKTAARNSRVGAVITTGTMGVATQRRAGSRGWVYPEDEVQLRAQVERTVFDPALIDKEDLRRRRVVLDAPGYRQYFEQMFSESPEAYAAMSALTEDELAAVRCPVLLAHGADDLSFTPESTSLPLARAIATADALVLAHCAHSVAIDQAQKLLDLGIPFLKRNLA